MEDRESYQTLFAELASNLRLSTSPVRGLPIPTVNIFGERRYRQSEVRKYLADLEPATAMRWGEYYR